MKCRDGHDSTDPEFCDVCGIAMTAGGAAPSAAGSAPNVAASSGATPGPGGACPTCGEPRADASARFCEVCRFDFVAKAAGPPPVRATMPTPVIPKVVPVSASPARGAANHASAPSAPSAPVQWELVVSIDPALDTEPDPEFPCPKAGAERVYPIDRDELLIGRQDDRRDIHPDIEVADPGASRRHAKFVRTKDLGIALQDLASTNGTKLNGTDVSPGSRHVLEEGDRVTLGRWTQIVLRGRA